MRIRIKKLHPDAVIPTYATLGAAGFDLVAIESVGIDPGETKLVKTGLAFEIPEGYEMQVRPRSGLSLNTMLRVANSPGTIDADFRGEVCVIMQLQVTGKAQIGVLIEKGDRIAQGVLCPIVQASFLEVADLNSTVRGAGGFGSSGA